MLCWPQGAYWAWLPGGLIIPARVASASAWSAEAAAAAVCAALSRAFLAMALFRRSAVTASRR